MKPVFVNSAVWILSPVSVQVGSFGVEEFELTVSLTTLPQTEQVCVAVQVELSCAQVYIAPPKVWSVPLSHYFPLSYITMSSGAWRRCGTQPLHITLNM